jgi:hypothetical protein
VRELPELKIKHRRGKSFKYKPAWDDRFYLEGAMQDEQHPYYKVHPYLFSNIIFRDTLTNLQR